MTNQLISGFRQIDHQDIVELRGEGSLWQHEKTGARLFFIDCEDDNKVFSVSFRTPPADDTGLPHILEHSVLCGSRKFPLKEPFVELVKGSLNTFLNAMTYPDKTMYPVASRNDRDFKNLVDVYLDAVFFPNIYNNPWTLRQEGWHYELDSVEGEVSYNGVVYNEMKGVFSSSDAILEREVFKVLFPDTPYGKESGGDPDAIPNLTQAQFEEFHRTYYHPSNSFIFLYGKLDITEYLTFFDQEYLGRFDKLTVNSEILPQSAFKARKKSVVYYPVTQDETIEGKALLSLNWVTGLGEDPAELMGLDVLSHILLETSASPLKKALQDANIGKEISGHFQDGILQPIFSVVSTHAKEDQEADFIQVIESTLEKLATDGLDPKLVAASLHRYEFQLREGSTGTTPKGLIQGIRAMDTWLYGGHPVDALRYEEPLKVLKDGATQGFFENLIKKCLLNNSHQALVIALPQPGLSEQKEKQSAEALQAWKAQQSEETLLQVIAESKELEKRQGAPDSPEQLATIPLLDRKDLKVEPDFPVWQEKKLENQVTELTQELFTSRILYLSLYFDTHIVEQKDVPYLQLVTALLGRMNTSRRPYSDLSNEINLRSGGLSFSHWAVGDKAEGSIYHPRFTVKTKMLGEDLAGALELLEEILLETRFDDSKRLKELIAEARARWESSLSEMGQQLATGRLASYLSEQGAYNDLSQLPFYRFLKELDDQFEERKTEIQESLKRVCGMIFRQPNLLINRVGGKEEIQAANQLLPQFLEKFSKKLLPKVNYKFDVKPLNEGLLSGSKVQYVAQGFNFRTLGKSYRGIYKLLETVLRYDYFWTRIRVQGGAYGSHARFERAGTMMFSSYRDPNLVETLNVYKELPEFLRSFAPDEREMTKYVIGTISGLDTPLTPSLKGDVAVSAFFSGVTAQDVAQERLDILKAQPKDLQDLADWIESGIAENTICIFGGEEKLKKQTQLFSRLIPVTEF